MAMRLGTDFLQPIAREIPFFLRDEIEESCLIPCGNDEVVQILSDIKGKIVRSLCVSMGRSPELSLVVARVEKVFQEKAIQAAVFLTPLLEQAPFFKKRKVEVESMGEETLPCLQAVADDPSLFARELLLGDPLDPLLYAVVRSLSENQEATEIFRQIHCPIPFGFDEVSLQELHQKLGRISSSDIFWKNICTHILAAREGVLKGLMSDAPSKQW